MRNREREAERERKRMNTILPPGSLLKNDDWSRGWARPGVRSENSV